MVKCGARRGTFYCPSNAELQNDDKLWAFPSGVDSTSVHSATGYHWLMKRPRQPSVPPLLHGRKFVEKITERIRFTLPGNQQVELRPAEVEVGTDM